MRAVIFTGPSLSHEEARSIFDSAEYRPPIKRDDAIKAAKDGFEIIGIIDGVFLQDVAVSPRELLEVIKSGARVVGGGSIGALRAAELSEFGMIGVGEIFRMFKEGILDSDDEVAVIFNPITYEPLSEPLVNIRSTVAKLTSMQLIEKKLGDEILRIAKNLHYSRRSYRTILKLAADRGIIDERDLEKLNELFEKNRVDLKKLDAIKVVEKVKELSKI